jgi:hypothetical protein
MAVIDGIGWKSRISDLRRIYESWQSQQIDGMYSLATLDQFREDLHEAARAPRPRAVATSLGSHARPGTPGSRSRAQHCDTPGV